MQVQITFMQVRLKTFMQVQKTFMQIRLKTFMQVQKNIYASTIENIFFKWSDYLISLLRRSYGKHAGALFTRGGGCSDGGTFSVGHLSWVIKWTKHSFYMT